MVAGGVPVEVVDRLQAHDVDVGDDEPAIEPASPVDLVVELIQARAACARPGQRIGFRDPQLVHERLAVGLGLRPVARGALAVVGRVGAIRGRPRPALRCRRAVRSRTPAVLRRSQHDFSAREGMPVERPGAVARRKFAVPDRRGRVASHSRPVARLRDDVASRGRIETPPGSLDP
jgi:hypothetical protein